MADKLNELAGKFGKGGTPKGLGVGIKLLAVAAAGVYGLKESMYTGKMLKLMIPYQIKTVAEGDTNIPSKSLKSNSVNIYLFNAFLTSCSVGNY